MAETIYPEDFFNIPSPTAPWVVIQFRTSFDLNGGKIVKDNWEEITLNPNNFFDSLTLEDKSGLYHVNLTLLDKNFANLENIIMKSITASRLANNLDTTPNYEDSTKYFNFIITNSINANLRIRFGYSIWEDGYIDSVNFSDSDFQNRHKSKKPVIRTPWIYLQIVGVKTSFNDNGFKAEINAYSTTNTFLDRAKMVQKYAKLVGKPKDVITQIGKLITNASKGEVEIAFEGEDPKALKNENNKEEIQVMLGSEPYITTINGKKQIVPQYRSLKRLFDLIISKIAPIKYKSSGEINQIKDDTDGSSNDETNEDVGAMANYGYVVSQKKDGDKIKTIITFKYLDPIKGLASQKYIRTYSWLNSGQSIIKNFGIQNTVDYAQMNAPIMLLNSDGQTSNFVAGGSKPKKDDIKSQNDFKLSVIKNITDGLKNDNFKAFFTSTVLDAGNQGDQNTNPSQDASIYATQLINNLNNGVFKGEIEMAGDPFYLFDGNISPYVYNIKILVRRPDFIGSDGSVIEGGLSYLSGDYVIGTITHSINSSGFTTKLDVIRFPLPSKEK